MSVQCTSCNKMFKNHNSLRTHVYKLHSIKNLFSCIGCKKFLSTQSNLDRHTEACPEIQRLEDNKKQLESETEQKIRSKHFEQLCDQQKTEIEVYRRKIEEDNKKIEELTNQLIKSKDEMIQFSHKTLSKTNIQNHNQGIQLNVNSISDIDLVRILQHITNESIKNAYFNACTNLIDISHKNPKYIITESSLISNLLNSKEIKKGVVITDKSRHNYAWINGDKDNQLIRDNHGKQLIKKVFNIPSSTKDIQDKISTIIDRNLSLIRDSDDIDEINKEDNLEVTLSNRFFTNLKINKLPDKYIKKIGHESIDIIPDKSVVIREYQELTDIDQIQKKREPWKITIDCLKNYLFSVLQNVLFLQLEQLPYIIKEWIQLNSQRPYIIIKSEQNENTLYCDIKVRINEDFDNPEYKKISREDCIQIIKLSLQHIFVPFDTNLEAPEIKKEDCSNIDYIQPNYNMILYYVCKAIFNNPNLFKQNKRFYNEDEINVAIHKKYKWLYSDDLENTKIDNYFIECLCEKIEFV